MESAFQFTNPTLASLSFQVNEDFENPNNKEIQIQMKMSVSISKDDGINEAVVRLCVEIGEKNELLPFWIKAVEQANFRWDSDVSASMAERLLHQNAPSLLLSYLRPIIVQVTAASPYDAYNIPFINFSK